VYKRQVLEYMSKFSVPGYSQMRASEKLLYRGEVVGVTEQNTGLIFTVTSATSGTAASDMKSREIGFNPAATNLAIMKTNFGKIKKEYTPVVYGALYDYYLYDLVSMQFFSWISTQKDEKFRAILKETFNSITLRSDVSTMIKNVISLSGVSKNSKDISRIIQIYEKFKFVHKNKDTFISELLGTRYDLDKGILQVIKDMSFEDRKKYILEKIDSLVTRSSTEDILKSFKEQSDKTGIIEFPNVYDSCLGNNKNSYCSDKKLMVPTEFSLATAAEFIAQDINNDIKMIYYIDRLYYDNVIDLYKFDTRGDEGLYVKKSN